jgi:predicted amidohydrolase YtcJ
MTPSERLDVPTAIRAYTLGAAEIAGLAERIGRLAPGYLADFVLLTGPLGDPGDFDRVRVARTVLGGDTVFER